LNVNAQTRLVVRPDVHTRAFQDDLVVLDLVAGEYFSLDTLGARVWAELAAGKALLEIVNAVAVDYDVEVSRLRADVLAFANDLVRRGLMVERLSGS
jgi:Coenzyme PQQ synthesis protein D (PqqD)